MRIKPIDGDNTGKRLEEYFKLRKDRKYFDRDRYAIVKTKVRVINGPHIVDRETKVEDYFVYKDKK